MRVYVGADRADLERLASDGVLLADGQRRDAHALTPALVDAWPEGSPEEHEYALLVEAAEQSLALPPPGEDGDDERAVDPLGRVVVVAELPPAAVTLAEGTAVAVVGPLYRRHVDAVHADDPDDDRAVRLVRAARGGDAESRRLLEGVDLGWFGTQEIEQLLDR